MESNNNNNNNNFMYNLKAKVTSVITGTTGTIFKSLRQYLSNIPRKHKIKEIEKNSHIGHCTHIMESADIKIQNIFHGRNNITCGTNYKYKTAATLYALEIWLASGI
jgi:hypothetical protein